jgi:hypothetical protein
MPRPCNTIRCSLAKKLNSLPFSQPGTTAWWKLARTQGKSWTYEINHCELTSRLSRGITIVPLKVPYVCLCSTSLLTAVGQFVRRVHRVHTNLVNFVSALELISRLMAIFDLLQLQLNSSEVKLRNRIAFNQADR